MSHFFKVIPNELTIQNFVFRKLKIFCSNLCFHSHSVNFWKNGHSHAHFTVRNFDSRNFLKTTKHPSQTIKITLSSVFVSSITAYLWIFWIVGRYTTRRNKHTCSAYTRARSRSWPRSLNIGVPWTPRVVGRTAADFAH